MTLWMIVLRLAAVSELPLPTCAISQCSGQVSNAAILDGETLDGPIAGLDR